MKLLAKNENQGKLLKGTSSIHSIRNQKLFTSSFWDLKHGKKTSPVDEYKPAFIKEMY